jgi:hypothetical protein
MIASVAGADCAGPFLPLREDVGEQRERGGKRHGGAEAHHGPCRDELRRACREAAGQAGGADDGEPGEQHALAAEPVGQAAKGEQQRREDEVVGVDDPLQLGRGGVQVPGEGGQRDVHQGRVEVDEERREEQRHEDHWLGSHGLNSQVLG